MHLARHAPPEGSRLGPIAEALGVSLSFVVAETRRLQRKRLVTLQRDPADGRAMLGRLTATGVDALTRAAPLMQQLNDRLFAGMTRADMLEMGRLCTLVHGNSAAALALLAQEDAPAKR
jgi:DNA-binding MarR family transcriptional regulator